MKEDNFPVVAVVGETASGKTAAAIAIAKRVGGEIVCADSRTVYRCMDIGTAKPTREEQKAVRHHLIDVVDPDQKYSAVQFQADAKKCIQLIQSRGKLPIVVGGTGLYVDALLYNYQFPKQVSDEYRTHIEQMNDEELTTFMVKNNVQAEGLNTKNRRHVINAIVRAGEVGSRQPLQPNVYIAGIQLEREILKKRIEKRVEKMFAAGFLDEVKHLAERYGWEVEAMSGIGYRVAKEYFAGSASLQDVKESFIKRDMSLAKRQRTWFKRNPDIHWFDNSENLIASAIEFVSSLHYNKS